MAWVRVFLLLLWPLQAMADSPVDALRGVVLAGNVAGVEALLRQAVARDMAAADEPWRQRDLFTVFTSSAPEVADFLDRWRMERPDSALAMTAYGWHLYALGWNARGTGPGNAVYPDAMDVMQDDHAKAWDLAEKAAAAEPDLIAASDLKLMLTTTLGNPEIIPVALEQVMTRHPNRGSLMRAMTALAPQWGGSPAQVNLLCGRYAPMITSVPFYDMQVCAVDGVYYADFWTGPQREEAHQLLQLLPNPVLDYARVIDAVNSYGPPQQLVKVLEREKAKRHLTPKEATALDDARIAAGTPTADPQAELKIALGQAMISEKALADQDPYNPQIVVAYVRTAQRAREYLGTEPDWPDLIARLQHLLTKVPYAGKAWTELGYLMGRDAVLGVVDLDRIARTEPYYINGMVYSNYSHSSVKALVGLKVWAILDENDLMKTVDVSGLTKAERARYDDVVYCPMIRQMTILTIVCRNQGIPDNQCAPSADPTRLLNRLREAVAEGSCPLEVARTPEALAYSPIKIDFPAAP